MLLRCKVNLMSNNLLPYCYPAICTPIRATDTIGYGRRSQAKNNLSHTRKPDTFACKKGDG
jgi:hypothetical protein